MKTVRSILLATAVLALGACDGALPSASAAKSSSIPTRELSVSISGADLVTEPGDEQYTTNASGGDGTYTYVWEENVDGQGWQTIGWDNPINVCIGPLSMDAHTYTLDLRVTVTSGVETAVGTKSVTVSLPNGLAYPCSF